MGKRTLMDHQIYALEMLKANPALGVFYQMGLGKTAIALIYAYDCIKKGIIRDALVICPASLVASWEQAIDEMVMFEGFDSMAVKRLKDNIVIRSFQKTYRTSKTPVKKIDGTVRYRRQIDIREDIDKPWGLLIVDELHQCSSHSAVQTNVAITLAKMSKRRIGLTATPTHGGHGRADYSKLYGEIQVLTAGKTWRNWSEFCKNAVISTDRFHNPSVYDEPYCRKLLENHAIFCRIEDCMDMPDKVEQNVPCKLAEREIYDDVKKMDVEKYGIDVETAGGQYIKLLQVTSGSLKIDDSKTMTFKSSKDGALEDILAGTDEPVVVFCNFRASIDRAAAIARKCGRKVVTYDGRAKKDDWKAFADGRKDCIIAQYQSGSAGLNLQNSHIMVFFEPTLSALLLSQAQGRIYRKGQEQKCIYYYLVTPNTFEKKIFDTVREGVDVNEEMLAEFAMEF